LVEEIHNVIKKLIEEQVAPFNASLTPPPSLSSSPPLDSGDEGERRRKDSPLKDPTKEKEKEKEGSTDDEKSSIFGKKGAAFLGTTRFPLYYFSSLPPLPLPTFDLTSPLTSSIAALTGSSRSYEGPHSIKDRVYRRERGQGPTSRSEREGEKGEREREREGEREGEGEGEGERSRANQVQDELARLR